MIITWTIKPTCSVSSNSALEYFRISLSPAIVDFVYQTRTESAPFFYITLSPKINYICKDKLWTQSLRVASAALLVVTPPACVQLSSVDQPLASNCSKHSKFISIIITAIIIVITVILVTAICIIIILNIIVVINFQFQSFYFFAMLGGMPALHFSTNHTLPYSSIGGVDIRY